MADKDDAILLRLREDLHRLNSSLALAAQAGLSVELKPIERGLVGSAAPIIIVSGRVTRARIDLDERL